MQWCDSCRAVFKNENLLTAPSIYIYEVAKFVKCNKSLFQINDNTSRRKVTHKNLQMPVPRLETFRKSCVYMAPLIFNSIPQQIATLTYNRFGPALRHWLIEKSFYSVDDFLSEYCRNSYYLRNAL